MKDTLTESEVHANIRDVCRGRTTLLIAHRLSTVMMADKLFVLGKEEHQPDNTIIETGTHQELLKKSGIYASMWKAQVASNDGTSETA